MRRRGFRDAGAAKAAAPLRVGGDVASEGARRKVDSRSPCPGLRMSPGLCGAPGRPSVSRGTGDSEKVHS